MFDDELSQSFDDGCLANARLTDKYGVVLLTTTENLEDTLYLVLPAHRGVELAIACSLGEVGGEVVKDGCLRLVLGVRGVTACCRGVLVVVTVEYGVVSLVLILVLL